MRLMHWYDWLGLTIGVVFVLAILVVALSIPNSPRCTTTTTFVTGQRVAQTTTCVQEGVPVPSIPTVSGQQTSIIDASNPFLVEGGYCYDVLLATGAPETWCYTTRGREHIKFVSGRMS